ATLVALVVVAIFVGARPVAKNALAKRQLAGLRAELSGYQTSAGTFPTSIGHLGYRLGLVFLRAKPDHPRGNAYHYVVSEDGTTFTISSAGPDGKLATNDDLAVTSDPTGD